MIKTISAYLIALVFVVGVGYYLLHSRESATYENGTYVLDEVCECNEYIYRT